MNRSVSKTVIGMRFVSSTILATAFFSTEASQAVALDLSADYKVIALTRTDGAFGPGEGAGVTMDFLLAPVLAEQGAIHFYGRLSTNLDAIVIRAVGEATNSAAVQTGDFALKSGYPSQGLGRLTTRNGAAIQNARGSIVVPSDNVFLVSMYDSSPVSVDKQLLLLASRQATHFGEFLIPGSPYTAGFNGVSTESLSINSAEDVAYNASIGLFVQTTRVDSRNGLIINEQIGVAPDGLPIRRNRVVASSLTDGVLGPGMGPGTYFGDGSNAMLGGLALLESGDVLFFSIVNGNSAIQGANNIGIFLHDRSAGVNRPILVPGTDGPLGPGLGPGVIFNSYFGNSFAYNRIGGFATSQQVTDGQSTSNVLLVYDTALGTRQQIARDFDPVHAPPGQSQTLVFNGASPLQMNDAGDVLMLTSVYEASATRSDAFVSLMVHSGADQTQRIIARNRTDGELGPGLGAGVEFNSFHRSAMNEAGQVAFLAILQGTGVGNSNAFAMYFDNGESLTMLLRTGDEIDVDPGPDTDLRVVDLIDFAGYAIEFQGPTGAVGDREDDGLNGNSLVLFARFVDGSGAVLQYQVPEPTTALGVLLGLGLVARRSSSRRN